MKLSKSLSVLSKSSPYAVRTSGKFEDPHFEALKDYLYVETDIEAAFVSKLDTLQPGDVLFLCGSSGDGKSEILTRYQEKYRALKFHLDATHSFSASATAIETLDEVFTQQQRIHVPLVVGINIGMLGNYQQDGSHDHLRIRNAIAAFLGDRQIQTGNISFLDFESFPKFRIEEVEVKSDFFSALLEKIARNSHDNPFQAAFENSAQDAAETMLCSNYRLLRKKPVQRAIIELLFQARVRKDQFITARMLLDFVYLILTGPGYLFDNLFSGGDNELLSVLEEFDPAILRNRTIDSFLVERKIGIENSAYHTFNMSVFDKYGVDTELKGPSQIRLFFLLRYSRLFSVNRFTSQFSEPFQDSIWHQYCQVWLLHREYDGDSKKKQALRRFYSEVVFSAINRFANRNAPELNKDEFFISTRGDYIIAAELELGVQYSKIKSDNNSDQSSFNLHISVGDEALKPVPVTINLLDLMWRIVNGYRPNRHDKNSIVLLDELVHYITSQARQASTLHLFKQGSRDKHFRLKQTSDDEIRVTGL